MGIGLLLNREIEMPLTQQTENFKVCLIFRIKLYINKTEHIHTSKQRTQVLKLNNDIFLCIDVYL